MLILLLCCSSPDKDRSITGTVKDIRGNFLDSLRIVGSCEENNGSSSIQFNTTTDSQGEFSISSLPEVDLHCNLQGVDFPKGLQPISAEFELSTGESEALSLIAYEGSQVSISIFLDTLMAQDGNVAYLHPDYPTIYAEVKNGIANFTGLQPNGKLYYIGNDPDFPQGPASGCKIITSHMDNNFVPGTDTVATFQISSSELKSVYATIAEPSDEHKLITYLNEADELGFIPAVRTANGEEAVFPCLTPGNYVVELLSGNSIIQTRNLEIKPDSDSLTIAL